jgi:hypothetical protein
MGHYNAPPDFIAEIKRLQDRVAALANRAPVGVIAAPPTDAPLDGAIRVDISTSRLWVRIADVWKSAALM